jgi:transcriptional regulator with XRE-family HTH domain
MRSAGQYAPRPLPATTNGASLTPAQVRAARKLLGWWQSELANRVRVSEKAIRDFESGELSARPLDLELVREALEDAGIDFNAENAGGAPIVRLQKGQ